MNIAQIKQDTHINKVNKTCFIVESLLTSPGQKVSKRLSFAGFIYKGKVIITDIVIITKAILIGMLFL